MRCTGDTGWPDFRGTSRGDSLANFLQCLPRIEVWPLFQELLQELFLTSHQRLSCAHRQSVTRGSLRSIWPRSSQKSWAMRTHLPLKAATDIALTMDARKGILVVRSRLTFGSGWPSGFGPLLEHVSDSAGKSSTAGQHVGGVTSTAGGHVGGMTSTAKHQIRCIVDAAIPASGRSHVGLATGGRLVVQRRTWLSCS